MDDFQWLEDKPPKKHHQWLQDYWLHIIAVVVILLVLLLLLFNPATKSGNSHSDIRLAEALHHREANEAAMEEEEDEAPRKQILIRMPDKSTKQVESAKEPREERSSKSTTITTKSAPSTTLVKPTEATPKKVEPIKETPKKVETKKESSTEVVSKIPSDTPIGTLNTKPITPPAAETKPPVEKAPVAAVEKTPAAPVKKTPPPATTPAPKVPATTAPATASGDSALYTMLKRPASHYVIQLFGSDSEASVKNFIAKNNLSKEALYVTVWYNNQNWYIVLYGDYKNRTQALNAIEALPLNLSNNSPWPRSVQSVQEAIRQRLIREGM